MTLLSILIDNQIINIPLIIELVREQYPERDDVIEGLKNVASGHWSDRAYFRFVDSTNANQPGAEWQHDTCIVVDEANIVIDLLKDGRIGGIEFLSLIE